MAKRRIEEIQNEIQNANGTELFIVSDNQSGKYTTKKMGIDTIRNYVRAGGNFDGGTGTGGGVMDGTVLKSTEWKMSNASDRSHFNAHNIEYTVENDCLLWISYYGGIPNNRGACAAISVGGMAVWQWEEISSPGTDGKRSNDDIYSALIPVKAGSIVRVSTPSNDLKWSDDINTNNGYTNAQRTYAISIKFVEYQLQSLNPQYAFPDWDKPQSYALGTQVQQDGVMACIVVSTSQDHVFIKINQADPLSFGQGASNQMRSSIVIPMKKGDTMNIYHGSGNDSSDSTQVSGSPQDQFPGGDSLWNVSWKFYPAKGVSFGNGLNYGGGVIDGSRFHLNFGPYDNSGQTGQTPNELVEGVLLKLYLEVSAAHRLIYEVQNDCGLFIQDCAYWSNKASDVALNYYLDDRGTIPILSHSESYIDQGASHEIWYNAHIIPLKKGTKIYANTNYYHNDQSFNVEFMIQEFKLQSLNPQIATPDYSRSKLLKNTEVAADPNGYVMSDNGWIITNIGTYNSITEAAVYYIEINGLTVGEGSYGFIANSSQGWHDDQILMRPVSKGDVVKIRSDGQGGQDISSLVSMRFVPTKAVEAEKSSGLVVPDYSAYDESHRVGSRGITSFGEGHDVVGNQNGYAISIERSRIGDRCWKAKEDCFFFPCAYAKALPNGTQDTIWPIYVFVGYENDSKLFKVFSHDGSNGNDLCANWMVPLKKGQIIAIWNGGSEQGAITPDSYWLPVKS